MLPFFCEKSSVVIAELNMPLHMRQVFTERIFLRWLLLIKTNTRLNQFVIFKPLLSYCFEETIGFDIKASFTSRPVSRLISWYNNQVIQQNNFDKRLFSSTGLFIDWKSQTEIAASTKFSCGFTFLDEKLREILRTLVFTFYSKSWY